MERLDYFRQFHDISTADYDLLTVKLKTRFFRKGDLIVMPGQVQKELYFVKSGVQMSYFDTNDKTHVIAFTYFLIYVPSRNLSPSRLHQHII